MSTDHDRKSWAAPPLHGRTFLRPIDHAQTTQSVGNDRKIAPRRNLRCTVAHISKIYSGVDGFPPRAGALPPAGKAGIGPCKEAPSVRYRTDRAHYAADHTNSMNSLGRTFLVARCIFA